MTSNELKGGNSPGGQAHLNQQPTTKGDNSFLWLLLLADSTTRFSCCDVNKITARNVTKARRVLSDVTAENS